MQKMTRRAALAAIPAMGAAAAVPAMAEPLMTPDERIDAAVREVVAAFREKWPNCPIRIDDCDNGGDGMLIIVTDVGGDEPGALRHRKIGTARRDALACLDAQAGV